MARLFFRYGAMNSGKTTAMLQAAYNYEERGHAVLIAQPALETKGDLGVMSRLGVSRKADFIVYPESDLYASFQRHREEVQRRRGVDIKCFLLDEAQFLTEAQVDDLLRIALLEDIPVLAFGIRTDIVPDKETRVTVTPDKAGKFAFLCDVFCGDGHEEMGGVLIVEA